MASKQYILPLRGRSIRLACNGLSKVVTEPVSQRCARSMATQTSLPYSNVSQSEFKALERPKGLIVRSDIPAHLAPPPILTTLYSFPALEPLKFIHYPSTHLGLPLRRDILHRAVIFEGDMTRQGTASTKWRAEVHGSGRKIRPQKGSGKARLGDKKSPMLRGGGVAFGPQPRDFTTGLNKKVYDMAWRTALSYRYKKGELVVVDSLDRLRKKDKHWLNFYFERLEWGSKHGRSLLVMKEDVGRLAYTFNEECGGHGRVRSIDEVDVKNLLEMKRLVIEKDALNAILRRHQSDLKVPLGYGRGLTTSGDTAAMEQIVEELEDNEAEMEMEAGLETTAEGTLPEHVVSKVEVLEDDPFGLDSKA